MPRDTEHDREDVITAVHSAKGKVTLVARILDVTPQTVYNYADRWKTVKTAIDEARRDFREGLVDKAEIKLEKAVDSERAWAIKYALDRQGDERGYAPTQRQEITGEGGGPVDVNVVRVIEHKGGDT